MFGVVSSKREEQPSSGLAEATVLSTNDRQQDEICRSHLDGTKEHTNPGSLDRPWQMELILQSS